MTVCMELDQTKPTWVLRVAGELDYGECATFRMHIDRILRGTPAATIVDLSDLDFLDSSGLGVLLGALRRAREREGSVRIVCARENVLKIFRITGLDKTFPIFSDIAQTRRL